jgi:septal ring factor EnvC (AmiA/AmiB activator)
MIWPVNGVITSPYGYRTHPIFGTTIYHSGIDIGVDYGTPVQAADGGTVVEAGWVSGYGYAVVIDHGNGLSTLYGHNQELAVSAGPERLSGPGHRLRRLDRQLHRPARPLRSPRQRRPRRSAGICLRYEV